MERIVVTGSREEAMLVPSVTKYNEIYMPTVGELTSPQRMANISYYISQSQFSNNGTVSVTQH